MGFFSKLFLGGLGWTLGGPIGAIIGLAIAAAFDNTSDSSHRLNDDDEPRYKKTDTTTNDFMMSLLVLEAAVMKADGAPKRSELNVVKEHLRNIFTEEEALEALQLLKNILQQDIPVEQVTAQVRVRMTASARRELLYMLFSIAYADGEATLAELRLITRIAGQIGISRADTESIHAMFGAHTSTGTGQSQSIDWAYKVLEITPDATDDEVKKAYRKMALRYHPDRVNTLGEEVMKRAEEKFRKVHEAYEAIKTKRGMK